MLNITPTQQINVFNQILSIDRNTEAAFQAFIDSCYREWYAFWFEGESPSLKIEAMGTSAVKIFTISAIAQAFIKQVKTIRGEEYEELGIPNGYTFTPNQDGSGTITGEYLPTEEEVI